MVLDSSFQNGSKSIQKFVYILMCFTSKFIQTNYSTLNISCCFKSVFAANLVHIALFFILQIIQFP